MTSQPGYNHGHLTLIFSIGIAKFSDQPPLFMNGAKVEVDGCDQVEGEEVGGHEGCKPEEH